MVAGWPFDDAVRITPDPTQPTIFTYERVNKVPSWNLFNIDTQSWMSSVQLELLKPMKTIAIIVTFIMLYMWIGDRIVSFFKYLFTKGKNKWIYSGYMLVVYIYIYMLTA